MRKGHRTQLLLGAVIFFTVFISGCDFWTGSETMDRQDLVGIFKGSYHYGDSYLVLYPDSSFVHIYRSVWDDVDSYRGQWTFEVLEKPTGIGLLAHLYVNRKYYLSISKKVGLFRWCSTGYDSNDTTIVLGPGGFSLRKWNGKVEFLFGELVHCRVHKIYSVPKTIVHFIDLDRINLPEEATE